MPDSIHLACPRCDAINRLPAARLGSLPKCGKCHQSLFTSHPAVLTGANFDRHVGGDLPVLVDFWAPWCGYCQRMAPAFAQALASLEPRMRLATVNTEAEPGLAARYAIRGLPTLVLFRQGREIARHSGAMAAADIVNWARSHA